MVPSLQTQSAEEVSSQHVTSEKVAIHGLVTLFLTPVCTFQQHLLRASEPCGSTSFLLLSHHTPQCGTAGEGSDCPHFLLHPPDLCPHHPREAQEL